MYLSKSTVFVRLLANLKSQATGLTFTDSFTKCISTDFLKNEKFVKYPFSIFEIFRK